MAYSIDYRQRVFKIKKEEGLTYEETGKRFKVNIRTLFRWKKRIKPKKNREKAATKIDMEALKKDVEKNPDRYQYERANDYGVTQEAIFYALRRMRIRYKKNSVSSQSR